MTWMGIAQTCNEDSAITGTLRYGYRRLRGRFDVPWSSQVCNERGYAATVSSLQSVMALIGNDLSISSFRSTRLKFFGCGTERLAKSWHYCAHVGPVR